MKRSEAVTEAAQCLFSAELAIDAAYAETALLAHRLTQLRVQAGLSAVVGQSALNAVTATLGELAQARSEIVRAHGELNDVKTRIGCRTIASGGGDKGSHDIMPDKVPLSVVAA